MRSTPPLAGRVRRLAGVLRSRRSTRCYAPHIKTMLRRLVDPGLTIAIGVMDHALDIGARPQRLLQDAQDHFDTLPRLVLVLLRWGDRQLRPDRLGPVEITGGIKERHHHFRRQSSPAWKKKADALRRISCARFNSRFSRFDSMSRSRSVLVTLAHRPWSRSACRTHLRRVCAVHLPVQHASSGRRFANALSSAASGTSVDFKRLFRM